MKSILPTAAALTVALALLARAPEVPETVSTTCPPKRGGQERAAVPVRTEPVRDAVPSEGPEVSPRTLPELSRREPARVPTSALATGLLLALDKALVLQPAQTEVVRGILASRDHEIDELHRQITASRVICVTEYNWRCQLLRKSWAEKVGAVLDSSQHPILDRMMAQGLFAEGLQYQPDDEMTYLE